MTDNYLLLKTSADENISVVKVDQIGNDKSEIEQKYVLVETTWGQELATILNWHPEVKNVAVDSEIKFIKFFKKEDGDLRSYLVNAKKKEKEALDFFSELIKKHHLDEAGMKPIKTSLPYDQQKLIFYYTAPDRVDFRGLLRDLISQFSNVIRLQQISPRQSAKIVGGAGICGNEICCHRFLYDPPKVSKDSLSEQGLADNNKEKFKGPCGRLRCCLVFEQKSYQEAAKNLPKIGETVKIKNEAAVVLSKNILKQELFVEFSDGKRGTYALSDLK
jgi:cell fate regulator YaaT (PSP1 superfamily)